MYTYSPPFVYFKEIPFSNVEIKDTFWGERIRVSSEKAIFHQWNKLEEVGTIDNFRLVTKEKEGFRKGYFYVDSDAHKWAEAAALIQRTTKSDELKQILNDYLLLVKKAQKDGYIFTYNQFHFPEKRWINLLIEHELYSLGHLIEAVIAYYQSTNDKQLLEIGIKTADLLVRKFRKTKPIDTPGHPEIEIALLKLYRLTNKKEYLKLAEKFLEQRGRTYFFSWKLAKQFFSEIKRSKAVYKQRKNYFSEKTKSQSYMEEILRKGFFVLTLRFLHSAVSGKYLQQHVPIRKMTKPVGHSVRWGYLVTAITMLYQETGDSSLLDTLKLAWEHMVNRRMFITGGIGSLPFLEGFGRDYELNIKYAYVETCAAISSIFWNMELLLTTGEAKFADLLEWQLYNAFLVGMSLDGESYSYSNLLEAKNEVCRKSWYNTACCPSNISRTLAKLGKYIYTYNNRGIWIHQYIGSSTTINLDHKNNTQVKIEMKSNLPWEGNCSIRINCANKKEIPIYLRIPSWEKNPEIKINNVHVDNTNKMGNNTSYTPNDAYYIELTREWQKEDLIEINFPMKIKIHYPHPKVRSNKTKIVLSRGPLVYCFENIDNPESKIPNETIDLASPLVFKKSDILNGIGTIEIRNLDDKKLIAIPYYSWGNRGQSSMQVWIKHKKQSNKDTFLPINFII